MVKLYHRDVYLPIETLKGFIGMTGTIQYSRHAQQEILNDRYGRVTPPFQVTLKPEHVIEIELTDGKVSKIVLRLPYDAQRDIVMPVIPDGMEFAATKYFAKTVWINLRSDGHKTLNRSRYSTK